jgi:hypothetical protein
LAICFLGAGSRNWIVEQDIRSGPVIFLLVLAAVGVSFIAEGLLRKQQVCEQQIPKHELPKYSEVINLLFAVHIFQILASVFQFSAKQNTIG